MILQPEEPEATGWRPMGPVDLLARLLPPPGEHTPVVAIDGRGGAGKSTLAARLAELVPGAVVVHADDLSWHEPFFDWAERLVDLLGWVRAGGDVRFTPPAWTERGRQGSIDIPSGTPLVIVEGTGAAQRAAHELIDSVVWVQSDLAECERRGIERDVAEGVNGDREQSVAFWHEWMGHELRFFADDKPWQRATLVVAGTRVLDLPEGLLSVAEGSLSA